MKKLRNVFFYKKCRTRCRQSFLKNVSRFQLSFCTEVIRTENRWWSHFLQFINILSLSPSRSRSHTHTHTRSLTHTRTHKHLLPFSFSLHFFFEKTIGRETEACRTNNSRYEGQESLFSRQCRLCCNLVIVIHHTISKIYDSIRIVWTKNSVQLFNVLSCDVREHLLWYMTVLLKMIRPYRNLIIWFWLVLLLMTQSIIEIPNLNLLSKEEKKCCLKSEHSMNDSTLKMRAWCRTPMNRTQFLIDIRLDA